MGCRIQLDDLLDLEIKLLFLVDLGQVLTHIFSYLGYDLVAPILLFCEHLVLLQQLSFELLIGDVLLLLKPFMVDLLLLVGFNLVD